MLSLAHRAVILTAVAAALAAVLPAAQAAGVDPNTYRVGHPASPQWKPVHAGQEHPAVQVLRAGAPLDPNHYLVQPPAAVHWTMASAGEAPRVAAAVGGLHTAP